MKRACAIAIIRIPAEMSDVFYMASRIAHKCFPFTALLHCKLK
jgi:hypothetical protein